ncbi:hypothetical protein ARMSODRAFT_655596 [Armillaria solidipes]|uniref:Uncharacterized protein n=1 Tax=Armillaria solidipes TaxID=1076256 RepID=A0A2H3BAK1_9AGAR|nr:hypothetical protein ARMSODRAFT_655596 [Armillaria solidipes]
MAGYMLYSSYLKTLGASCSTPLICGYIVMIYLWRRNCAIYTKIKYWISMLYKSVNTLQGMAMTLYNT